MDLEMYVGGGGGVALIIATIQMLKGMGMPAKYGGLVAVLLGLGMAFGYGAPQGWPPMQCIVTGMIIGLSAAGFYSTQKATRGL